MSESLQSTLPPSYEAENDHNSDNDNLTALKFQRLQGRLYGRSEKLQVLQDAYNRVAEPRVEKDNHDDNDTTSSSSLRSSFSSPEICLVTGYSGTGKTTLVRHIQHYSSEMFFVSGKFHQMKGTKPYSALSAAMEDLCATILKSSSANTLKKNAMHAMKGKTSGEEQLLASVLIKIVPAARTLLLVGEEGGAFEDYNADDIDTDKKADNSNKNEETINNWALQQLKYAFRLFLRSICTPQHPVVLFMDDMQWIDSASLELLMDVLADSELRHFLFIGAYRDNEVTDVHPLLLAVRKLEEKRGAMNDANKGLKEESIPKLGGDSVSNLDNESSEVRTIESTELKKEQDTLRHIKLDNLRKEDVNELLADLLQLELPRTESLADIVCRRTHGNIFFVLEYIKHLYEEQLLYFSTLGINFGWKWDLEKIVDDTMVSGNVVDMIVGKFQKKLPDIVKDLLKITSCLDDTFHSFVLWQIVKEDDDAHDELSAHSSTISTTQSTYSTTTTAQLDLRLAKMSDLEELLEIAIGEGIIERTPRNRWYKFSHDKFQQAAYSLLDDIGERQRLHYRIGRVLLPKATDTTSTNNSEAWRTFVAVDQLNRGSACIVSEDARIKMANLNLLAGEMASRMSAYVPAMEYFLAGLGYLPDDGKWDKQYKLSLDLLSAAAEVAYVNADFKECHRFCNEIMDNAAPGMDRMRAVFTLVDSLGVQQRANESVELAFQVLREALGEPFPKKINLFHVIASLFKTQGMIRKMSDGELLALPVMTDARKVAAMKLLSSISTHAYFLQKAEIVGMVNFRMMQLSVKYGVARLSPAAFARYGLVICAIRGDIKEAYRFGRLALTLVDQLDAREWEAQVVCLANQFLLHWQEPYQNLTENLLRAFQLGNEHGDIEFAMYSAGGYALCYYHSGLKLGPIAKDLAGFCNQMKEHGQFTCLYATLPYWQGILNLMGRSKEPFVLTGEAMREEEAVKIATESNNASCLHNMFFFKAQLAYFLGQFEMSKQFADEFRKWSGGATTNIIFPSFVFYSGLINLACANQTGKRKYVADARKDMKTLKNWVQKGAINSFHKLKLLQAQFKAVQHGRKVGSVKEEFEQVLNAAARAGYLQDRAIAHQLLGEYLLSKGMDADGKYHIGRAHQFFTEWGAIAVANHIRECYSDLLSKDESCLSLRSTGTGFKARTRLDTARNKRASSTKTDLLRTSLQVHDSNANLKNQEGPGNRRGSSIGFVEVPSIAGESGFLAIDHSTRDVLDVVSEIQIPHSPTY